MTVEQFEAWLKLAGVPYKWCPYDGSIQGVGWWLYFYPKSFPLDVRGKIHYCRSLEEVIEALGEVLHG